MLELSEKNLMCHFGEVLVDIKKKCAYGDLRRKAQDYPSKDL